MISEVYNGDCMEFMAKFPDKFFELAIVDPPYGINRGETFGGKNWKEYDKKEWDTKPPSLEYFIALQRVSKNQIVWGANYYPQCLTPSMGWVFWDKGQDLTMSDGELAYTSFNKALRRIIINRCHISEYGGLLHPTQKPVRLYKWLLDNYAKPGDKILDTHMGSQSSRIAAHQLGFDYWGSELDAEYFEAGNKRYQDAIKQQSLFAPQPITHNVEANLFSGNNSGLNKNLK